MYSKAKDTMVNVIGSFHLHVLIKMTKRKMLGKVFIVNSEPHMEK